MTQEAKRTVRRRRHGLTTVAVLAVLWLVSAAPVYSTF